MSSTDTLNRRRTRAVRHQQAVHDLDVRWAFRSDRLPLYAEAVSICSCGRRSWLMPGASDDEWADYIQVEDDHAAWCEA